MPGQRRVLEGEAGEGGGLSPPRSGAQHRAQQHGGGPEPRQNRHGRSRGRRSPPSGREGCSTRHGTARFPGSAGPSPRPGAPRPRAMGAAGRGALRLGPEPAGRGGTGLGEAGGGVPGAASPGRRHRSSVQRAAGPWLPSPGSAAAAGRGVLLPHPPPGPRAPPGGGTSVSGNRQSRPVQPNRLPGSPRLQRGCGQRSWQDTTPCSGLGGRRWPTAAPVPHPGQQGERPSLARCALTRPTERE